MVMFGTVCALSSVMNNAKHPVILEVPEGWRVVYLWNDGEGGISSEDADFDRNFDSLMEFYDRLPDSTVVCPPRKEAG